MYANGLECNDGVSAPSTWLIKTNAQLLGIAFRIEGGTGPGKTVVGTPSLEPAASGWATTFGVHPYIHGAPIQHGTGGGEARSSVQGVATPPSGRSEGSFSPSLHFPLLSSDCARPGSHGRCCVHEYKPSVPRYLRI